MVGVGGRTSSLRLCYTLPLQLGLNLEGKSSGLSPPGPPKLLVSCPHTLALSPAAEEIYVAMSLCSPGWKAGLGFGLPWRMRRRQRQQRPRPVCPWRG